MYYKSLISCLEVMVKELPNSIKFFKFFKVLVSLNFNSTLQNEVKLWKSKEVRMLALQFTYVIPICNFLTQTANI